MHKSRLWLERFGCCGGRASHPGLLTERSTNLGERASMAEAAWSSRPPGGWAVGLNRDTSAPPGRNQEPKQLRCSFCEAELGGDMELTSPGAGKHGRRTSTSSFCSTYCRDCVLALGALHPSPLASSDFISKRALLTDRLLVLWRRGQGPDPVLVLKAARNAGSGLAGSDTA
jgi:hypothetical protein